MSEGVRIFCACLKWLTRWRIFENIFSGGEIAKFQEQHHSIFPTKAKLQLKLRLVLKNILR